MRQIRRFIVWTLLTAALTAACADEEKVGPPDEPIPTYPLTPFSAICLSETMDNDAFLPVTSIQTYRFTEGRISRLHNRQLIDLGDETLEMEQRTDVSYDDSEAVVTEESGSTFTYTLNRQGYATQCIYRTPGGSVRRYTFSYHTDAEGRIHLTELTERLGEEGEEIYANLQIDYSSYPTLKINQTIGGQSAGYTTTADHSATSLNRSGLPDLFLSELHPLAMHPVALYGKWLGEPLDNLISHITPDGNGESDYTEQSYDTDGRGYVTGCTQTIHSHGKRYERTIQYQLSE